MNYMEQVAKMLGVELEEEFNVSFKQDTKYRFTEGGLEYFSEPDGRWLRVYDICNLLKGDCEIVKIPKPILDDVERKYLSNIIKPWRNCVKCIFLYGSEGYEYILIKYYRKIIEEDCDVLL